MLSHALKQAHSHTCSNRSSHTVTHSCRHTHRHITHTLILRHTKGLTHILLPTYSHSHKPSAHPQVTPIHSHDLIHTCCHRHTCWHIHTVTHVHTHALTQAHAGILTVTHVLTHICSYVLTHKAHLHALTQPYTHIYTHAHSALTYMPSMFTCADVCSHIVIHVYMYAHEHTHCHMVQMVQGPSFFRVPPRFRETQRCPPSRKSSGGTQG